MTFFRYDSHGQCGFNSTVSARSFNQVPQSSFQNELISQIDCGSLHTLFLTKSGNLYAAGYNNHCQISNVQCSKLLLSKIESNVAAIWTGQQSTFYKDTFGKVFFNGEISKPVRNALCSHSENVNYRVMLDKICRNDDFALQSGGQTVAKINKTIVAFESSFDDDDVRVEYALGNDSVKCAVQQRSEIVILLQKEHKLNLPVHYGKIFYNVTIILQE